MKSVSSYQMGAFEALEWVWHMLRTEKEHNRDIEEAYNNVQNLLVKFGKGSNIDFRQEIKNL